MDAFLSTFILLVVSAVILAIASVITEDLSQLQGVPLKAFANFGLAGFVHFFLGWTFINISQSLVGAARTGALMGTTPLFAFVVGILAFGELLSLPIMLGIVLVLAGVYLVSAENTRKTQAGSEGSGEELVINWRNSLFGLGVAVCFSISAIFIRGGLEDLPSPLLGVTIGMVVTAAAYGIALLFRGSRTRQGPVSRDTAFFQLAAGVFVGLATWARWVALDMSPVAVVLSVGRVNVPVVILVAPLLVGRKQERVTGRVWLGAGLIVAGSLVLNFYS
jgi:drug/metabolite transporter (DMT)-like permease